MAESRGSILISTANKIGATLVKKLGGTGYTPSEWADKINLLGALPEDTVSGAIANFPDGAEDVPVVELIANIEPKQAGSGDPAPDNVRPISGYTAMNISKQGKNLWSVDSEQSITRSKLVTFPSPLKAGTYTLTAAVKSTTADPLEYCQVAVNTISGGTVYAPLYVSQGMVRTFTVSEPIVSFTLYSSAGYSASAGVTTVLENIQIEVGSTATDYEPYAAPEVKTISWETEAGTVYGGYLNVTTGELTVDRAIVDMGGLTWLYDSANTRFYTTSLTSVIEKGASGWLTDIVCSCYKTIAGVNPQSPNLSISEYASTGYVYVKDTDYTDVESFLNSITGNMICYKLATPEVYQLEPEEVKTLLGVNNIYSDTGDVSVKYRADIPLYIEKITQ